MVYLLGPPSGRNAWLTLCRAIESENDEMRIVIILHFCFRCSADFLRHDNSRQEDQGLRQLQRPHRVCFGRSSKGNLMPKHLKTSRYGYLEKTQSHVLGTFPTSSLVLAFGLGACSIREDHPPVCLPSFWPRRYSLQPSHSMSDGIWKKEVERTHVLFKDSRKDGIQEEILEGWPKKGVWYSILD